MLGAAFLALAVIAVIAVVIVQRRAAARARARLALESASHSIDPKLLLIGVDIARAIGWRRAVPLALAGLLAASISLDRARRDDSAR